MPSTLVPTSISPLMECGVGSLKTFLSRELLNEVVTTNLCYWYVNTGTSSNVLHFSLSKLHLPSISCTK
ncbi:unnamed protein product [Calypogeia fissa]